MKRLPILWVLLVVLSNPAVLFADDRHDTTWSIDLSPLSAGLRWDDNVNRASGTDRRADRISSLTGGAELHSIVRNACEVDVTGVITGDSHQAHPDLDSLLDRFQISLSTLPAPWRLSFGRRVLIRRSQESDYDHWDDEMVWDLTWTPDPEWRAGASYRNTRRSHYDPSPQYRARDYGCDILSIDGFLRAEQNLTLMASLRGDRSIYNRYAVRWMGHSYGLKPDLQTDRSFTAHGGLRWFQSGVLGEVHVEWRRNLSNNHGSTYTARSVSWAAAMDPIRHWTLQGQFRLYDKRYAQDPLGLLEFGTGYTEEDSQELFSGKVVWEFLPQWDLSATLARLRSESVVPGTYYVKRVVSIQLQKRF